MEGDFPAEPYSEVVPGLFQASSAYSPAEMFDLGFDALFDLCGRDRTDGEPDPRYVFHPIDDVPYLTDPDAIHDLGERVADFVRSGKQVAVSCMSGINRSGLLVGRALIALGYTPQKAIEAVRRARGPRALSNRHFTRFLLIECTPRKLAERRQSSV